MADNDPLDELEVIADRLRSGGAPAAMGQAGNLADNLTAALRQMRARLNGLALIAYAHTGDATALTYLDASYHDVADAQRARVLNGEPVGAHHGE